MKEILKGSKPGLLPRSNSIDRTLNPTTSPGILATDAQWHASQSPSSASLAGAGQDGNNGSLESTLVSPTLDKDDVTYPEGGLKAWLVVLGSFSGMTAGFGYMNLIATYQAYISHNQLSEFSDSAVGWIFSVYACFSFGAGIFVGPVFDAYGPRWLVFAGTVFLLLSVFLMSVCKGEWLQMSYLFR